MNANGSVTFGILKESGSPRRTIG